MLIKQLDLPASEKSLIINLLKKQNRNNIDYIRKACETKINKDIILP